MEEVNALLSEQQTYCDSTKCNIDLNYSSDQVTLGQNVCYIVGAVIVNSNNEILLIQEAKRSCKGLWYLPAGRVERNETLVDAVKREVLEEAGLVFEPNGLICVEENTGMWMRFIFAGSAVGGALKDKPDSESLQAGWFQNPSSVKLRSKDILKAVKLGLDYYNDKKRCVNLRRLRVLPMLYSHKQQYIRAIILKQCADGVDVLCVKNADGIHLPLSYFKLVHTIDSTLQRIVLKCLSDHCAKLWLARMVGLVAVEHQGRSDAGFDGICLTILANLQPTDGKNVTPPLNFNSPQLTWQRIDSSPLSLFSTRVEKQKEDCVPIVSLAQEY